MSDGDRGMRLSDDKINHLSHVVMKALGSWDGVDFLRDENDVRLGIKEGLNQGMNIIEAVEEKVRRSLLSYSRKILEGSREWDVMFAKTFEEELHKLAPSKE
jgi:hypothetical protein